MPSFDIVSKTDLAEVDNAIAGIRREIATRFDFKDSACTIERKESVLTILADDAPKLEQMEELVKVHFTRRKIDPSALEFKDSVRASGDQRRQEVVVKQGIDAALAKRIVKDVKESKLKVQVAIQGEELRVTGKKRDDLQAAIAFVKGLKIDQPLQFDNFRE
jgi:cyclic-di-GMP-binding protein